MGGLVNAEGEARKILVALDESEESMYALSWCLNNIVPQQLQNSQDTLVVLHVKRPTIVYPGLDNSAYLLSHDALSSLDRRDSEMATWILQKAEKLCMEHDVKVQERVEEGDPGDVICEMVKVLKADMLVMGCHGYGPLTRYPLITLYRSVVCYTTYTIWFQGDNEECEPPLRPKCKLCCSCCEDAQIKSSYILFPTNEEIHSMQFYHQSVNKK